MKKMLLMVCLAMMTLIPWSTPAAAVTGDSGLPGEYQSYDIGARASGMAGAMAGLADDVSAIFYNPAGLANQNPIQIGVQHVILFENTMFDFLGFAMPIREVGNIGVGIIALTSPGFDVRDENYNVSSDFSSSMMQGSFYLSYARDLMSNISAGASVKVAYDNFFGHTGTGVGIDVGGTYRPIPEMQIGLYLQNALTPQVLGDTYFGKAVLGIGGMLFNDDLLLDVDVSKSFGPQPSIKWKVGGELDVYEDMAFVRAGLDDEMRVSAGVGAKYMNITLDYAAGIEPLGISHKISAGYSFGGFEITVKANPKIFSPVGIKKTTTFALTAVSKYPIRDWEFNIKDQNGDIVKSWSGEENPPNQIVWTGKDDRGLPAPDGNFSAQLITTDSNGKVIKSNIETVKIQSAVPLGGDTGLSLD